MTGYDISRIRGDFPILGRPVHGQPLVYLDSASTAQTPRQVLEAMDTHQRGHHANVGRSAHALAAAATAAYEDARAQVAAFIGGHDAAEVVFTRNATEALNLVASAFRARSASATARTIPACSSARSSCGPSTRTSAPACSNRRWPRSPAA